MGKTLMETIMGAVVLLAAVLFMVFAYQSSNLKSVEGYALKAKFTTVAGIALGTSLGAWINVGTLIAFGRTRGLLRISNVFWRAFLPSLLAAAMTAAGALAVVTFGAPLVQNAGRLHDAILLTGAIIVAGIAYCAVVYVFRRALPLGPLSGRRA